MWSLPLRPTYSQSAFPYGGGDDFSSVIEKDFSDSFVYKWVMAAAIIFTMTVFTFEKMLDQRQAKAYQKTEFPSQLKETVSKIDSEKTTDSSSKKEEKKEESKEEAKKEEQDSEETAKSKVDKDKPILPQLEEKFTKSQEYGSDKIKFSMVYSSVETILTVVTVLLGDVAYTWDWSREFLDKMTGSADEVQDEIKISLIFITIYSLACAIIPIPFEMYSTFKIEKKHGFNKMTYKLFFTDKLKSFLLSNIIGLPVAALILKIIKWGGDYFYLYIWAFMFAFSTLMMTLVPVIIMPMFNKYEPLQDGELKTRIYALADQLKYPLTKLFVMDGSKRSSHSNAFMFGFGSNKRIVLFDTLMDQVDDDEILAILGHELGHWALGHTWSNFFITQIYTGAAFYCFSLCYHATDLYAAFGFDDPSRPVPTLARLLFFFMIIWAPVDKALSFVMTLFSRHNEFAADRFSADLGMSKKLQTGLCKISLENLGAMCPDQLYATYHYSHPPLVERLSAMMEFDKKKE